MRKAEVEIGATYVVKVSGQLVEVRVVGESVHGGWIGRNLRTGREVRLRTAARLRRVAPAAAAPAEGAAQ